MTLTARKPVTRPLRSPLDSRACAPLIAETGGRRVYSGTSVGAACDALTRALNAGAAIDDLKLTMYGAAVSEQDMIALLLARNSNTDRQRRRAEG